MQTEPASAEGVQQTLDAVVERLLLLNRVVEHLGKADAGGVERVFKNARFLNTSNRRTLARAGGLIPMTMLPVTYGYARVSKSDDAARNLETQLRLLADHGIREDLIFSDIATGRTLRRTGWQELMSRLRPGDTLAVAFLDRLSRNFEDGVRIQADLTERNIGIVALRENIDTSDGSAAAKFFRRSMLAQGAYQVDSTSERIKLGLDLALPRQLRKLDTFDFLLLDDLGYLPQGAEESEVLFTLIAERYERRSLGITSNLVFSQWERIASPKTLL